MIMYSHLPKERCLLLLATLNYIQASMMKNYKTELAKLPDSAEIIQFVDYEINILNTTDFERFENLTTLTLKDCEVEEVESDFFAALTKLTMLNLEDNDLDEMPTKDLGNLEILNLHKNNFTSLAFLTNLKKLKTLVLDRNPLTIIKTNDFKENTELEKFQCEHCHDLVTIEDSSFSTLAKLKELMLDMTKIKKVGGSLKGLNELLKLRMTDSLESPLTAQDFNGLSKLEYLDLRSNALKTSDIQHLPKSVKDLDLSGNAIEEITNNAFNPFTNLEKLQLQTQQKKPLTIQDNAFSANSKLTNLNIADNQLPDLSMALLGTFKTLNLSMVQLGGNEFNCTCHDVKIWEWFQKEDINFEYPCMYPSRLRNQDLVTMSVHSLGCIPPYFTTEQEQEVHLSPQHKAVLRCEARSFYERPTIQYEIREGNPLNILNSSVIVRYIKWDRVELEQVRYYSAISFTSERAEKNQTGSIRCNATNQWGETSQVISPRFVEKQLLLPIWAIAAITCTGVVIMMAIVVVCLCIKRSKSDSVDMIGTVNGHVRNLAV